MTSRVVRDDVRVRGDGCSEIQQFPGIISGSGPATYWLTAAIASVIIVTNMELGIDVAFAAQPTIVQLGVTVSWEVRPNSPVLQAFTAISSAR